MSAEPNTNDLDINERPRGGPFSIGQVMDEWIEDYEDALQRERKPHAA